MRDYKGREVLAADGVGVKTAGIRIQNRSPGEGSKPKIEWIC